MRVLLLSAYAAQSHRHWQGMLRSMFPDWTWRELNLSPRHFSWRVRGNALYWALAERAALEEPHDLLIATSMVDLATLRGLVPALARVPTLLYFHENQFAYPRHRQRHSPVDAQVTSLYSALAADRLAFNSAWNRDSFLQGCDSLLSRLPDCVPPGVVDQCRAKSGVLPVPIQPSPRIDAAWPGRAGEWPARPLRLLWAGRFEHDKGGEGLLQALSALAARGSVFELAMVGQQFRNAPEVFAQIRQRFADRLVQFGYLPEPGDYRALLRGADIVLSTATHEFQGLAVLEAVAAGCLPAVPDRLAYPELYPPAFRYPSSPDDPQREAAAAADLIVRLSRSLAAAPDVSACFTARLRPRYAELLGALAESSG